MRTLAAATANTYFVYIVEFFTMHNLKKSQYDGYDVLNDSNLVKRLGLHSIYPYSWQTANFWCVGLRRN
ncbi:MAG: hypothetical protein ACJ73C_06490 [Nitrososphaeraceae archaeon]